MIYLFGKNYVKNLLGTPAPIGKVVAIELPAGSYNFEKFRLKTVKTSRYTKEKMQLQFNVHGGKATYIGSINVNPYQDIIRIHVSDERSRDLEIVKKVWSNISEDNILFESAQIKIDTRKLRLGTY